MSVLIKGMEMPKNEPLLVKINPDGTVSTTWKNNYKKYKAIPVPDHGDLIDRDAVRAGIKPLSSEDERNGCTFDTVKKLMHTMLDRAPAIIPADKEAV